MTEERDVIEVKKVEQKERSEDVAKGTENPNEKKVKEEKKSRRKLFGRIGFGCGCFGIALLVLLAVVVGLILRPLIVSALDNSYDGVRRLLRIDDEATNQNSVSTTDIQINVTEDEKNRIDVISQSEPSVVSIAVASVSFSIADGITDQVSNVGSGFIVDESGLVITNQHVVSNLDSSYTVIHNGESYEVLEIVRDDVNDIALLKINNSNVDPLPLGDSDAILKGQSVIAIGTPLGEFAGSVTTGIISGLNRSVQTSSGGFFGTTKTFENVIQTDAAINSGNSGGPLLNSEGEVIGVNFATSAGADNISFALPINVAKKRIDEYKKYGKFIRPYIGVEFQSIDARVAAQSPDAVEGAFVRAVREGSPAQQAGITAGDIITEIDGKVVGTSLINVLQTVAIGEELDIKIYRSGEALDLKITLVEAD